MKNVLQYSAPKTSERIAAVLVCLALFYFAAGGSFLHFHKSGTETVCHVCQSLHAPALAAAAVPLFVAPETAGWHEAPAAFTTARNEFSLSHAGRAPPAA